MNSGAIPGLFAAVLLVAAILMFVRLHVVDRTLSLAGSAVSEFALGPAARLFVIYGVTGSLGLLALAVAVFGNGHFATRTGIYLLLLAILRFGVLVFRTDPGGRATSLAGRLHLGFAIATFALMYMALDSARPALALIAPPPWPRLVDLASWLAAASLAAVVLCLILRARKLFGLAERLFLLGSLIGLALIGLAIAIAA